MPLREPPSGVGAIGQLVQVYPHAYKVAPRRLIHTAEQTSALHDPLTVRRATKSGCGRPAVESGNLRRSKAQQDGHAVFLRSLFARTTWLARSQVCRAKLFRSAFLFPYALSFIVTGVVWRWMFNPETGINLFFDLLDVNAVLDQFGVGPLAPGWTTDPTVVLSVNRAIAAVWPGGAEFQIERGASRWRSFPVAIAATWQLSGFVMAMYRGGLSGIGRDVRDAARIDGASEARIYRKVIIPMLRPITISTAIILLHVSLKIFDLVFAMSGVGPGFATDVPAIFVFEMMFKAARYNLGAAASIVMLVLSCLIIVPYLISTFRSQE